MSVIRPALAACLLALLVVPATAGAQGVAPPDSSELDQYVPAVPEAEQDTPVQDIKEQGGSNDGRGGGSGGGGDSGGGGAPPPEAGATLEDQGVTGESTSAAGRAGTPKAGKEGEDSGDESNGNGGSAKRNGSSSAAALAGSVAGSDSDEGMGLLLPLIIVATIVAGGLFVARRRIAAGLGRPGPGDT